MEAVGAGWLRVREMRLPSSSRAFASEIVLTGPSLSCFVLREIVPSFVNAGPRYRKYHISFGVLPCLYKEPFWPKLFGILCLGMFFLRETCPIGSAQLLAVMRTIGAVWAGEPVGRRE